MILKFSLLQCWKKYKNIFKKKKNLENNIIFFCHCSVNILFCISIFSAENEHNVSACFNQSENFLRAECDEGFLVKVDHVIYGHSQNGGCHVTEGDCIQEDREILPCIGRRSCDINLPNGDRGRQLPQCGLYSTYMQVQYSCVEGKSFILYVLIDMLSCPSEDKIIFSSWTVCNLHWYKNPVKFIMSNFEKKITNQ